MMTRRNAIAMTTGAAATALGIKSTALAGATPLPDKLKRLYDRALVIDGLAFAHHWDDVEYDAAVKSGYAGFVDSLSRRDLQTAIDELLRWRDRVQEFPDRYIIALEARDFERAKRQSKIAVMMNFQDARMLEGDADNVDALHALGMRCFQLTYNSRNLLGDGCTERTNAGLSDFGAEVVERMNKIGVLIDVSHSGKQTTFDAIELSEKPIAFTHTMVEKLRPGHPRAKTDEQIRALAEKGGVIGIAALGYFVGTDPGGETTIETYADHIDHAVSIAGVEHVALSTDFPLRGIASWATREDWYEPRLKAFKPSYDVKWPPYIPALDGPDRFRNLIAVLDKRGWRTGDIEKLLGENWLRLYRDVFGR